MWKIFAQCSRIYISRSSYKAIQFNLSRSCYPSLHIKMGCVPSNQSESEDAGCTTAVQEGEKHVIPGPIKTIVVLVMENRSFDHMLGWQMQLHPEIDGVTGEEFNNIHILHDETNNDANNTNKINVSTDTIYFSKDAKYVVGDPDHGFQAITEQVFGVINTKDDKSTGLTLGSKPLMSGFAQQAEATSPGLSKAVMSGFPPEALPIYTSLLNEFAVFDKWFASLPASTQPNRQYVHSATSHGLMSNVRSELLKGLPQRTIFDNLYDEGLSFGIYFQSLPSTIIYRRLRQLKYIDKFHLYSPSFKKHAKDGSLPNYVVIEPRFFNHSIPPANDDHPPHNVSRGQALVKEVYETLRGSPQWEQTLLIITYDEHGGFFDHVPTPMSNVPSPDGIVGPAPYFFKFDRLGVRVPTIMVSPWINKKTLIHTPSGPIASSQFEHSSIPATVKKLFNLNSDFLTKRDAWAATFETVVASRSTPRKDCPLTLPKVTKDGNASKSADMRQNENKLNEFQEDLVHLSTHLYGETEKADELINKGIKECGTYTEKALSFYLSKCNEAKNSGGDPSAIVCIRPSSSSGEQPTYYLEPYDP
ncbi:hypothetical protein GOP47_0018853 [Adiantum capillus-veneris]|uniref:Phospholipase C n=1 Tax=Adiantum capillus-veneris TaxID=13818 RepID=A0A9D4UDZ8_ADICA|nr:hypothetical protein GOP47_0018853 [Adiantum capillus-veneris]